MSEFNVEVSETIVFFFFLNYEVKSIINQSTCYKTPTNPSPIPNSSNSLEKSTVVETGLSDFHKFIVTVTKSKRSPKYTNFDKEKCIDKISFNSPKHDLQELILEAFISMFKIVFEKQAPLKKKYLRTNHSKFVTKELM